MLTSGRALRDSWPRHGPGLGTLVPAELGLEPVLIVPMVGSRRVDGVLVAARLRDRPAFTDDDLDMVTGFANQASLALELTEARAEQNRAAIHHDRDRIAADLHDHVIQRLFAAGLSLQSVAKSLAGDVAAGTRIGEAIADLDATISQIRTPIFGLHHVRGAAASGLRAGFWTSSPTSRRLWASPPRPGSPARCRPPSPQTSPTTSLPSCARH